MPSLTPRPPRSPPPAWLTDLGEHGEQDGRDFTLDEAEAWLEPVDSAWGRLERVRCPGRIDGFTPEWRRPPGPLGSDAPVWANG